MSFLTCNYCDKLIDTDEFPEHFHESEKGMCEAEQERLEFPVYCEDMGYYYKIDSPMQGLTVSTNEGHESIDNSEPGTNVFSYDSFISGEFKESTKQDFLNAFSEIYYLLVQKSEG